MIYRNITIDPFNAAPRIIDDGDVGFTADGNFLRSGSEGYLGDERTAETIGVTGDENVARWTFAGVTPGWYRVAVTWVGGANRTRDAQFSVLDGDVIASLQFFADPSKAPDGACVAQSKHELKTE